jgi:GTP pyrophosphokinase
MTHTNIVPTSFEDLVAPLPKLSSSDSELIERAYKFAELKHASQVRKSGEAYFTHLVAVAAILVDLKMDAEGIAAGLLHDILEDTDVNFDELANMFTPAIAHLVESVTKLKSIPIKLDPEGAGRRTSTVNRELEYIRKMFMGMSQDIRVVLIKLADRLHNMRTLGYMPEDKQIRIARETAEIFSPLANRLGIWEFKWQLEDLSLRYLEPEVYRNIAAKVAERRADREAYMARTAAKLRHELEKFGLSGAQISARPKHITSIYNKMRRKSVPFEQVFDVRAVRVIVNTIPECYQVMGIVHQLWRPIPAEFDDYIGRPKDNNYQSLHTAVLGDEGKTLEIQIRTWEMHEHAEYGIAAHWKYKEGAKNDTEFERRLNMLRKMLEFGEEASEDTETWVDTVKAEFFQDRVYITTPKGDIVDMPSGATPVDFAYHIHTDVGHHTRGARVNGQLVKLNHQLKSGEQVEILTTKAGGPSLDWLNEDLGYTRTSRAREKIRHYFRKLNREQHISMGRDIVEREMRKLGLNESMTLARMSELMGIPSVDDFFAAVGVGDISSPQIANRAVEEERKREKEQQTAQDIIQKSRRRSNLTIERAKGVNVKGMASMLYRLAPCCKPMVGDTIIGYITRGRGVTVHRGDCINITNLGPADRERLTEVSWGDVSDESKYLVDVDVVAFDRSGLLRDVSTVIAEQGISIHDVSVNVRGSVATIHMSLELSNPGQLPKILSHVEMVADVTTVFRKNAH